MKWLTIKANTMAQANMIREKLQEIKAELQTRMEARYGKEFLLLTGLKVGDHVECMFQYDRGNVRRSYGTSDIMPGVIKKRKDNTLYVESLRTLEFAKIKEDPMMGDWIDYEVRKGISSVDSIKLVGDEQKG